MRPDQAANELTEEQVLEFLVNTLDEEIWDVLVGATAGEDSVSHLCEISEESPHGNTILHHLPTKFELRELERVGKTLIQQDILELLPDRPVEVVADLHLRPYYGEEYGSKNKLYGSLAKAGTTTFHGYAPLSAQVRNKRYTLAVRRLTDGDTASSILAKLLGVLEGLYLAVKAVYLDREFYDTYCLTLLSAHNYAFVMPIMKWGEAIQTELSQGWSCVLDHDLRGEIDGHTWTVDFAVYIDCTYQQGRCNEEGVARHGYAVDALFIKTPRQVRECYSRRFGIESTYRLSERSIASTTTQNPAVRFLYVLIIPAPECVAVSPLGVRSVAAPRRATPLGVAIRRVPWDDTASSVDSAHYASRRPHKQASRQPLQTLIHRLGPPARRVATPSQSAAERRRLR